MRKMTGSTLFDFLSNNRLYTMNSFFKNKKKQMDLGEFGWQHEKRNRLCDIHNKTNNTKGQVLNFFKILSDHRLIRAKRSIKHIKKIEKSKKQNHRPK